ncbi:MAG: gliding motility-associated C-terminal domain-containing protein [Saprospiraceae bacterium]|nr:gliding motility-associated C-terminal domain-containing protein [Saprospiraceae bacterium]
MKRLFVLLVLLSCFYTVANTQCYCEDCPEPIIFGAPSSVSLNVSGITNSTLGQNGQSLVNVGLYFTHDAVQELSLRLVSPSGSFVDLMIGEGLDFGQNNYFDIDFIPCTETPNPDCTNSGVWNSLGEWDGGPYLGSYLPEIGCIEDLTGDVNGTWTLEMEDVFVIEDGEMFCFDLTFADDAGVSCNTGGCSTPICLAQGGSQMLPFLTTAPEGDSDLIIDYTITYDDCELEINNPDYIIIYVIYEALPFGPILEIQQGTVDMTGYDEGQYVVQAFSILASDLPVVEALDFANSTIFTIVDLGTSGTICSDNTEVAAQVVINNCPIDFTATVEFDNISAEVGDPSLDPNWTITYNPAAPDFNDYGVFYVVYEQSTGIIVEYLTEDDFTGLPAGDYNVAVLVYLLADAADILPADGVSVYIDLVFLIVDEELCAIIFGNNQLFISEPCTIDAAGILEQENITAPQNSPLLDPDWDITFSGTPPDPALYGFYFVVVNSDTDLLVAYYTTDDFTLLLEGNYYVTVVYYLLDDLQTLPPPNGVNTFLDLVTLINDGILCAQYFGYNELVITAGCEADAGTFNDLTIEECEGSSDLILDLTPDYPFGGPDATEYGYSYVVSENGVIIDITASEDFTGYSIGVYEICGLSYLLADESILPLPNGVLTTSDIQSDIDNLVYCADLTPDCITLTISETPEPIFTGPTEVCAGVEVEYVVENFSGNNDDYLYTINQGGFNQFINDGLGTLSVIWASGPGNICVTETQNGCTSEQVCLTIDVLPQPEVQIDGFVEVCPGIEYIYIFTPVPTGSEFYDISINGGSLINQNTNSIVVVWDDPVNGSITASLLNGPCPSEEVVLDIDPAVEADFPTVTIPETGCFGSGLAINDINDPDISTWTWTATNADIVISNGFVNFTWQNIGLAEICLEADLGCGTESMCYEVDVQDVPNPVIEPELDFCSLTFTLQATPSFGNSWFWTSPGSGASVSYTDQTNFVTDVTVTGPGTYTFVLQEFGNPCSGSVETVVTVTDGLEDISPFFLCDDEGNYIVLFDINSGVAPFAVDGNIITGNSFSSTDIISGDSFNFLVEDSEGCSTTVEGSFICPCISDAGTMSATPITLCISDNESGQGIHNDDATLDVNDLGQYVLHTGDGSELGTVISINNNGLFSFDANSMVANQFYYISYIVGDNMQGNVDLFDPCLSVAMGQPIVFYEDPVVDAGDDNNMWCGNLYLLDANAPSVGGTWSVVDQPVGSTVDFQLFSGQTVVQVDEYGTYLFELTVVQNGCIGSDIVEITFLDIPGSDNVVFECNGGTYTVSFDIVGGNPPYTINGTAISGSSFVSPEIISGESFSFNVVDASGCNLLVFGTENCDCETDAGTMAQEEIIVCAAEGEEFTATYNSDAIFDSNDVGVFILHTGSSNILGQVIATSESETFVYSSDFGEDITLYISYVVGDGESGSIDLLDECLSVSIGQPVQIQSQVKVDAGTYSDLCEYIFMLNADDMGEEGEWSVIESPSNSVVTIEDEMDAASMIEVDLPGVYSLSWTPLESYCILGDTTTFELFSLLEVANETTLCSDDLLSYVVEIEISGGEAPYFLDGIEVGDTYLSPEVNSGDSYSYLFEDNNGCEILVEGIENCQCENAVGTMALDTLQGCLLDTLIATYNEDAILDENDVEFFVLHTSSDNSLGAVIGISTEPIVTFIPGMINGEVYYISHIVGNAAGGGLDYTDPCLQISPGQPILFNEPPEVDAGEDQEVCGFTTVLNGSSSEITTSWSVLVSPPSSTVIIDENDPLSEFTVTTLGEYVLELETNNDFCSSFDTISILFTEPLFYNTFEIVCTPGGYVAGFTITGGTSPYFVNGVEVDGDVFVTDYLTDFGEAYSFVVTDSQDCSELIIEGVDSCACENDAGTMNPTPILACTDETINIASLSNGDYILDDSDQIYLVVHTSSTDQLGDVLGIYSNESITEINFDELPFVEGVTYYISIVLADEGALSGQVDDPCIAVANGTPIQWKENNSIGFVSDIEGCSGDVIDVEIESSGPFPIEITVSDGLGFSETVVVNETSTFFSYEISFPTNITIETVVDNQCITIDDGVLDVSIYFLSPIDFVEGFSLCNEESFGSIVNLESLILAGSGQDGQWFFDGVEIAGTFDVKGFEPGVYELQYEVKLEVCDLSEQYTLPFFVEFCGCPTFEFEIEDISCFGSNDGSLSINVLEGIDLSEYTFLLGANEVIGGFIGDLSPGDYTLDITDGQECVESFEFEILEPDAVQISLGEDMEAEINDPVVIEAITDLLSEEIDEITWSSLFGILDDNDLLLNTSFQVDDEISIRIVDENGCEASDVIFIRVTGPDYVLPNVINVNASGENNIFKIYNSFSIEEVIRFAIYDRWGNEMYEVENVAPDSEEAQWDGRFGNRTVTSGIYVYQLVLLIDGEEKVVYGDLMVM